MVKITGIALALLLLAAQGEAADQLCFDEAGARYAINPQILRAIAKVESNFNPRAINWNTNGSYDFGVMQINSSWEPALGRERWNTLGDPCSNIKTGASILAGCMKKYGYSWEAIGCYNSQTPDKRDRYARVVFKQLQRIQREEKELKANVEAAIRDRIDGLVAASRDGQGGELKITVPAAVPASPEASREPAAPPSAAQTPLSDNLGAELRASSLFEGTSNGM